MIEKFKDIVALGIAKLYGVLDKMQIPGPWPRNSVLVGLEWILGSYICNMHLYLQHDSGAGYPLNGLSKSPI